MITAHLKGGLGNQMFQIAATYSLALDNNDECAFFMGNPNINQGNPAKYYTNNVFRGLKELPNDLVTRSDYEQIRYMEPRFNFDPVPYREGMVLQGFFQSEKYFKHHGKEIINLFSNHSRHRFENSVSIHFRRGDYLDPFMSSFLPVLQMDYYIRALAELEKKVRIDHILVFSDSISWCKENFIGGRIIYIEDQSDYEDMYTMAKCDYHIIANSSFSWWGAYLNDKEKIVYAPANWFGHSVKEDWQDIYCENWIKI
jgi:hypothetical protein